MDDILYDDRQELCMLSIDPGTSTLGYGVIMLDIETLDITNAFAWTVDSTRLSYYSQDVVDIYGEKFARLISHKRNLENVLDFYRPLCVSAETPFFNRLRPSAGGPLYELYTTIEQTVYEWDNYKPLYKCEPKSVKVAVGASHNAKKDEMRKVVSKIKELERANFDLLDEHSIDALAIGYLTVSKLRKEKGYKK